MTKNLYSIRDLKAKYFLDPQCFRSDEEALRVFGTIVANPETMIHAYPADFALYYIGTFDDANAEVLLAEPHIVCDGLSFVGKEEDA